MGWIVLVAVLAVLAAIALPLLRSNRNDAEKVAVAPIGLEPTNDKAVIVKGWDGDELHKILNDFIEANEDSRYPRYSIEQHQQGDKIYRLTFPQNIHPELFSYFINYIAYPCDFNLTNRSIIVYGETTLNSSFEGIDESLFGQQAILYLPENDQDYDIVYMQTSSGVNFANSFSGWKRIKDARLSNEVIKLVGGQLTGDSEPNRLPEPPWPE